MTPKPSVGRASVVITRLLRSGTDDGVKLGMALRQIVKEWDCASHPGTTRAMRV
jgi:hypothetical protein